MKRPKKCDNRQLNRQTDSEKERWGKRKKKHEIRFYIISYQNETWSIIFNVTNRKKTTKSKLSCVLNLNELCVVLCMTVCYVFICFCYEQIVL